MLLPERSAVAPGAPPNRSASPRRPFRGGALGAEPGASGWADETLASETRAHIDALVSQGMTYRRIGVVSGLGRTSVKPLLSRLDSGGRMKATTAERLLAVRPHLVASGADLVPAEETWRLIAEMLAAGATKSRIAEHLGYTDPRRNGGCGRGPTLQLSKRRVTKKNADAVRSLHDRFFRGSPKMRAVCRCPWFDLGAA